MKSLDVGCGSCCRCDYGIDIKFNSTPTHLLNDILKEYEFVKNPKAKLIKGDINKELPFEDSSFDKVLVCHTLEHFRNPYNTLMEVKRVLKKGGSLFVVIPNPKKNDADQKDKTHLYSWTEFALENLLSQFFKVKKITYLLFDIDILAEVIKDGRPKRR